MIVAREVAVPDSASSRLAQLAFSVYKRFLGPMLHAAAPAGSHCGFQPTCSEYAMVAIAWHGPFRGSALALWRILRCNPWNRGGLDPVPPRRNTHNM